MIMNLDGKWCRYKKECPAPKDLDWGKYHRGMNGYDLLCLRNLGKMDSTA
jgi:hypothetical protein